MSRFHCCATCRHYTILKSPTGTVTRCSRLQYETQPTYKFDCWDPKDQVRKLMDEEKKRR
nr:hypothetical protein [Tumebacillus permanentifrigoris]